MPRENRCQERIDAKRSAICQRSILVLFVVQSSTGAVLCNTQSFEIVQKATIHSFILAFWAFIFRHFGLLSFHFPSFWLFGPSFPSIWAFSAFISFHFGLLGLYFLFGLLGLYPFISFHFGLLRLHFLLFWPFGPLFPFILAFWAFIFFHFGLLGLHFLSFWLFRASFPFIFGLSGLPRRAPPQVAKNGPFPNEI